MNDLTTMTDKEKLEVVKNELLEMIDQCNLGIAKIEKLEAEIEELKQQREPV